MTAAQPHTLTAAQHSGTHSADSAEGKVNMTRRQNTQAQAAQQRQNAQAQRLYAQQTAIMDRVKAQKAAQAQAEAETDEQEQRTFSGYADMFAQAAETIRDTHFLLSLPSVAACVPMVEHYQQRQHAAWTECTETARTLASIIAASVCKKVDNVSASDMTHALRQSRTADVPRMEQAKERMSSVIETWTDKDGKMHSKEQDSYDETARRVFDTIADGADLYQTAYETILAEAADGIDFEYTERVLDKRVVIRTEDSAAWKDVTITAGQKAHRACRTLIENSRAAVDNQRYCYLAELVQDVAEDADAETEAAEAILYHRLPKHFYEMDTTQDSGYNAHALPVTVSETDAQEAFMLCEQSAETLAERFNLSAQQKDILADLFKGYGSRAIGTALGISDGSVRNQIARTKQKVKTSAWYAEHTAAQRQAEAVTFLLDTEAEDSKTAAQRAAEATDSAQKAAQAAETAIFNAIRAAQAARTAEDVFTAAQKAAEADRHAQKAAEAARREHRAAEAAQKAARRERMARIHR